MLTENAMACVQFLAKWLIYLLTVVSFVHAWDSDDLEVFDVVEEVGVNFYTLLGVPQVNYSAFIQVSYRLN